MKDDQEYLYADHDLNDDASDGSEMEAIMEDPDLYDMFESGHPMGDWDH